MAVDSSRELFGVYRHVPSVQYQLSFTTGKVWENGLYEIRENIRVSDLGRQFKESTMGVAYVEHILSTSNILYWQV